MGASKVIAIGLLTILAASFWSAILYGNYVRQQESFVYSAEEYVGVDHVKIIKNGSFSLTVKSADLNESDFAVVDVNQFIYAFYDAEITDQRFTIATEQSGNEFILIISGNLNCNSGSPFTKDSMFCLASIVVYVDNNYPLSLKIDNTIGDISLSLSDHTVNQIDLSKGLVGTLNMDLKSVEILEIIGGGDYVGDVNIYGLQSSIPNMNLPSLVGSFSMNLKNSSVGNLTIESTGNAIIHLEELELLGESVMEFSGVGNVIVKITQTTDPKFDTTVKTIDIVGDVRVDANINYDVANLYIEQEVGTGDSKCDLDLDASNETLRNYGFNETNPTFNLLLNVGVGNIRIR